ncbi:MAG: hypothetical protein ACRD0I_04770 [Acidimicrobiales bacterium]
MTRTRNPWLGPASRPVAIPDDIDDTTVAKASGVVELPLHISWSEPSIAYDLSRRPDRLRVYEQVLREGNEADVRYYVDLDDLARVFDELVLPPYVRAAWSEWFRRRRRVP